MTCQKKTKGTRGNKGWPMARRAAGAVLLIGLCSPGAFAEEAEQARPPVDVFDPGTPSAARPLTDFEKLDLYHRRYTAAANNISQLFKQLNQMVQEVSLAAKTFEVKDSSYNQRLLETKLRQLENMRSSYSTQYSQLNAQMQNEYRNYAALSSELRTRYGIAGDAGDREAGGGDAAGGKKAKSAKTAKTKDPKARNPQTWESGMEYPYAEETPPDPRILDMNTKELRARRDAAEAAGASPAPGSPAPGAEGKP